MHGHPGPSCMAFGDSTPERRCPAEAELPAEFKLYLPVTSSAPMDQQGYPPVMGSDDTLSDEAGSLAQH